MDLENKITYFRSITVDSLDREIVKKEKKLKEELERDLNLFKQDLQKKSKELTEKSEKKITELQERLLAKVKLKRKKAFLNCKNQAIEKVLNLLETKMLEFSKTDEYKDYIEKNILLIKDEITASKKIKVYSLGEIEKSVVMKFLKDKEIEFLKLSKKDLGGMIIEITDKNIRYDISFRALINSKIDNIGVRVSEAYEGSFN